MYGEGFRTVHRGCGERGMPSERGHTVLVLQLRYGMGRRSKKSSTSIQHSATAGERMGAKAGDGGGAETDWHFGFGIGCIQVGSEDQRARLSKQNKATLHTGGKRRKRCVTIMESTKREAQQFGIGW